MKCPACGNRLQTMVVEEVSVNVCRGGCGGLWFDNHELSKFDEPHETAGEALLDVERNKNIHVDPHKQRKCPKCSNAVMTRRFFNAQRQVEIDECPRCAGVWLDHGELEAIRNASPSPETQEKAAGESPTDILGPGSADGQTQGSRRIARVFRFLAPRSRFWH